MDGALSNSGCLHMSLCQFKKAVDLLEEGYELCEEAYGHRHEDTACSALRFGDAISQIGRLHEGEDLMRDALSTLSEVSGEGHHLTFQAQESLGCHLMRCGRPKEAQPFIQASINACKKGTRPENPEALRKDCVMSGILAQLGDKQRARKLAKETLEAMKKEIVETAPSVGIAYRALATAYVAEGMAEEARAAATSSEAVVVECYKDYANYHGSTEEIELYLLYAACDNLEGAHEEALKRLDQAAGMIDRVFGVVSGERNHFEHNRVRCVRGETLLTMGRLDAAERELLAAVAGYEEVFGVERPHWCHGAALSALVKVYEASGRQEEALVAAKRSGRILADALG